jgi:hypothetical protein
MRAITLSAYLLAAGLFAATFAGSSASADWSSNYAWCLMTESSQECAFTSMAQCLASKHGNVDFCEPNNTYIGNTRSFGFRKSSSLQRSKSFFNSIGHKRTFH